MTRLFMMGEHARMPAQASCNRLRNEIAVIDDDGTVRTSLVRLLTAYSYHVLTYESAKQFLNSERVRMPACLIVDHHMQEMTGEELLHHLGQSGIRIPAIVLTGHDAPEIRKCYRHAGAIDFLVKPVMPDRLLKAIETALGLPNV